MIPSKRKTKLPYRPLGCMRDDLLFSHSRHLALLVAALAGGMGGAAEAAEAVLSPKREKMNLQASFDLEMIKERGLDPRIAEYFRDGARFGAGPHLVMLYLNGIKRGLVDASFDEQGQLCFNRELIDRAGLAMPDKSFLIDAPLVIGDQDFAASSSPDDAVCYDFTAMYPQTELELRPAKAEVSLVVPTAALRKPDEDFSGYDTGGTAGLLNYDIFTLSNQFNGASSNYISANAEIGFNSHDWVVRSRQSYTSQNKNGSLQSLYTYAQHTLVDHKSIIQLGQINIGSSVVSGSAITGFQIMPETALRNQHRDGATVEGIAQSQARIEVRQLGALIYSTVVPAGPFSLNDIPIITGNIDLVVTVIEANGAKRSFTVAAASLGAFSRATPGFSFAAGKVRRFGRSGTDDRNDPFVVSGSGGWLLNERNQLSAGAVASSGYQSVGWGLDSSPTSSSSIMVRNVWSSAAEESVRGALLSMSASAAITDKLNLGGSATRQSLGYRDLTDAVYGRLNGEFGDRSRAQYSASLNWNDATLGGFNVSYTNSSSYRGPSFQRIVGSWNKTFRHATVSANIERNVGQRQTDDSAFYVNVSIPLGQRSLRIYVNSFGGDSRLGTTVTDKVNDYVSYRVTTERRSGDGGTDVSGNLSLLPRYTQVNLDYGRSGAGTTTYVGQLRGGVALHDGGITLSPYLIQDTFSLLKVGDVSGVRVDTPGGPVWTDAWGRAVAPTLSAYRKSRLEVATKSLPRNVDIKNGFKSLDAGRGSVNYVDFEVVKVRRVLMKVRTADGFPLSKGASVLDGRNQFLTTVVDDGKLFLSNGQLHQGLKVNSPDGTQCSLDFTLSEQPDVNAYFETIDAVCRP